MWPGWFNLIFLLDSGLRELEVGSLEVGKGSENVLLNHGHHIVQVRDDKTDYRFLVLKQLLYFVDCVQSLGLALNILGFILVVIGLLADKKLLLEGLLRVFVGCPPSASLAWSGTTSGGL
jgi:hypothetical protein